jgi:tetratricopeptide (TPR) repeat protein
MKRCFARFACRLPAACALVVFLSSVIVHAEDVLSERLTDQIWEMNKFDLIRKLDSELEQRKNALTQEATVEHANNVRKLLKVRAGIYETLDDLDRAEVEYNDLIDVRPRDPTVYIDRGYFYMRQSRFDAAMHDFMAGSRLAPTQSAFSYGVGRALARMGDYAAAISQYDEAIRLAPGDSAPVLSRAEAYTQLGMYAQARADFDRVTALGTRHDADRFFVYFGRGYANIHLGDDDAAIRDLDVALSMRPRMVTALVWRGYARERLGQRQRALADYESALRVSPDDGWIRLSIRRLRT